VSREGRADRRPDTTREALKYAENAENKVVFSAINEEVPSQVLIWIEPGKAAQLITSSSKVLLIE
jgi:hypothetical protein